MASDERLFRVRFTDALGPDLSIGRATPADWSGITTSPVTWLQQVHGNRVVRVTSPGEFRGVAADAAVTDVVGVALAVTVADCAPLVLVGTRAIGVAHAGWRGLLAGVIRETVAALREFDDGPIDAYLGPCIHPECYEFGEQDLATLSARYGPAVVARTDWGTPALDLPAAVRAETEFLAVALNDEACVCTSCSGRHWSYRARADAARQAAVCWLESTPSR